MSKQLLSFVCLSVIALAHPVGRAIAAPGSTEESDRQFLSNLEKADPAPSTAAPSTADTSAPATKATKPQTPSQDQPSKATAVVKKPVGSTTTAKRAPARVPQLPEVADIDPQVAPAANTVTKVVVVTNSNPDRAPDHRFFHRLFGHMLSNHPEDW